MDVEVDIEVDAEVGVEVDVIEYFSPSTWLCAHGYSEFCVVDVEVDIEVDVEVGAEVDVQYFLSQYMALFTRLLRVLCGGC